MELRPWLSYHLYPLENTEVFLYRGIRPFMERQVWPYSGVRGFYVRSTDGRGEHVQLHLHGSAAWMETIKDAVEEWFEERAAVAEGNHASSRDLFPTPEVSYWAEEHFHLSSRVALERMQPIRTYGDVLFDALRLHIVSAYAAGWSREKTAEYYGQLCYRWAQWFAGPMRDPEVPSESWIETFEAHFRAQQEEIRFAAVELWEALRRGHFDPQQPEWLRWYRGCSLIFSQLGEYLTALLPDLIHLTNNRLGIQGPDEVYLTYALSKAL